MIKLVFTGTLFLISSLLITEFFNISFEHYIIFILCISNIILFCILKNNTTNHVLTNVYDKNGKVAHEWVIIDSNGYKVTGIYDEVVDAWMVKHSRTQDNLDRYKGNRIKDEIEFNIANVNSSFTPYEQINTKLHNGKVQHRYASNKIKAIRGIHKFKKST